jgi:hypothetical protein
MPTSIDYRAVLSGSGAQGCAAQQRALADEGEVVIAAGGVGDGGATVDRDTYVGQIPDVATIDPDRTDCVANTDSITGIAATVDIAEGSGAAAGRRRGNPTVPSGSHISWAGVTAAKELALEVREARLS